MSGGAVVTAAPAAPMPSDGEGGTPIGLTTPRAIALLLILFPTSLRVLLVNDPFPIWDVSPFKFPAPSVGVPPTLAMTLDVMAIVGAAMALVVSGMRVRLLEQLLLAAGGVVVAIHALAVDGGSLDNLRLGSCWVSALAAGIGVRSLASDPMVRKWIFALVMACAMPLAVQSLVQVFVEHPATVASYRANPQAFLDAQGWTPGSAMAKNYERRLMQPEATGWFGMANVHATFAAAFVIGWVGVVMGPAIERRLANGRDSKKTNRQRSKASDADVKPPIRGESVLIGLMVVLAVAMLVLTRSKGGLAACVLGLGMLGAGWVVLPRVMERVRGNLRLERVIGVTPPLLGPLVAIGVIGLIAVRGMIGTSIGELSLLFRWFYISAATRIFGEQPLLGVGPADFRPAYELAKNPLSPEEVTSPHSVVFDWISMLGVGGLAWTMILLSWAMALGYGVCGGQRSTRTLSGCNGEGGGETGGVARRGGIALPPAINLQPCGLEDDRGSKSVAVVWAIAVIVLACVTAFIIELAGYADVLPMGTTLADMAIVISQSRLPGMILWLLAAALLLAKPIEVSLMRRVLGCVGISLLASACIDVAPVWANSAGLFFVLLGLAASEDIAPENRPSRRERVTGVVGAGIVLTTAMPMVWAGARVMEWERGLIEAGESARAVGLLSQRLAAIEGEEPLADDNLERWLSDTFEVWDDDWWSRSSDGASLTDEQRRNPHNRLAASTIAAANWAAGGLWAGEFRNVVHAQTFGAAADAALERAAAFASLGLRDKALASANDAIEYAVRASSLSPATSSSLGQLARTWLALFALELGGDSDGAGKEALNSAISAFERAAALDPHGITYPLQLFELARQTGDRELARRWAEELLRRNQNMRLDPVRALTPEQVARAQAALRPSP